MAFPRVNYSERDRYVGPKVALVELKNHVRKLHNKSRQD